MTADRDAHGYTRADIAVQLDLLGDDETRERLEPASDDTTED